jgi:hypothetical protein
VSAHTEQDTDTTRRWICVSGDTLWVVHQELRQLRGGEAWVCVHFDEPVQLAPRPT